MTDGFTRNPAPVAHITGSVFPSRVASTQQWKQFREQLEARIVLLLLAVITALMPGPLMAQTFKTLYNFTGGSDGAIPGGLILSGNTLYGTTGYSGGSSTNGTIFSIRTDGTAFKTLHSFTALSGQGVNFDGAQPQTPLVLSGSTLYGSTCFGGGFGFGTVFKVSIDGTGFAVLQSFLGSSPMAGLLLSGNTLYGTTFGAVDASGGATVSGTVFKINTDGSGFEIIHHCDGNSGAGPATSLLLSGDTLYGTAGFGGLYYNPAWGSEDIGSGVVFALKTNGGGFTDLHTFTGDDGNLGYAYVKLYPSGLGVNLSGGLLLSGNRLFGTASSGGSYVGNLGTVFAVNTDGTGFSTLHTFTSMNQDGAIPAAGLNQSGDTLFGTTSGGGSANGVIFQINTNGTGYKTLFDFGPDLGGFDSPNGRMPEQTMVLSGNVLYGVTALGGSSNNGTIFSFSLPTTLKSAVSVHGQNLILSWPTYITAALQCTTNLSSRVWTAVSTAPAVVNGQNTVTNPISGTQQFFRLSQ